MQVVGPYLWSVRQAFYRVGTEIFLTFESDKSVCWSFPSILVIEKPAKKTRLLRFDLINKYTKFGDIATYLCHSQRLYVFQQVHSAGINRNDGDIMHTIWILMQFYWALSQPIFRLYLWCSILYLNVFSEGPWRAGQRSAASCGAACWTGDCTSCMRTACLL